MSKSTAFRMGVGRKEVEALLLPAFSGVVWSESQLTATESMLSSTEGRFRPEADSGQWTNIVTGR